MPRVRFGRKIYIVCLSLGSLLLLRSLVLQLFWPMAAADRPAKAVHPPFCTAQLLYLRKELEEATWQDMVRGLKAPKGFCAKGERLEGWQQRLAEVAERCQDLPDHGQLAARLGAMEANVCRLFGEAQSLWRGEGQALQEALFALEH